MTEQQLPTFMGNLVRFQGEFMVLPTEVAQWAIQNTAEAIGVMKGALIEEYARQHAEAPAPVVEAALLEFVRTISVPATNAPFKVSELFVVDTSDSARVKFRSVDSTFLTWFGKMMVKTYGGSELRCQSLTRSAFDTEIIEALGGCGKCGTTLAELWWMLEQQASGQKGDLLTDGCANIFYIYDRSGALRVVYVFWLGSGWYVRAFGFAYYRWRGGGRVFSRNSM